MSKFVLVILLCFSALSVAAEEKEEKPSLASLQQQLDAIQTGSERRLPVLTSLIKETWRTAPGLAEQYGNEALELFPVFDAPEQEATAMAYLARVYLDRRDSAQADTIINLGIAAAKRTENPKLLPLNLFNQAMLHNFNNKMVLALNSYRALESEYRKMDRMGNVGNILNNIANIQRKIGDLDGAFETYTEALPLIKEHSNPIYYANTLMNMGEVFFHIGDYEQAERNYLEGQALLSEKTSPLPYFESFLRLGVLMMKVERVEESLAYFREAERIGKKYKFRGPLVAVYYDMIRLAVRSDDKALLVEALGEAEKLISAGMGKSLAGFIHFYRALVAAELEDWQLAEENIDILFDNDVYDNRYYAMQDALNLAFSVKKRLNKLDQAIEMALASLKRYEEHQELNQENILAQYTELYKTNEKEREIVTLQNEKVLQQNKLLVVEQQNRLTIMGFVFVSLFLIAIAIFAIQRSRASKREKAMALALMQEKKQFFADISHELRTPLTVFKLKMEELEYNIAEDPESVYKLLHERIEGFDSLINDISILATNDKGELELNLKPHDIRSYFSDCASELETMARNQQLDVDVEFRVESGLQATFDGARIRQVLTNLFSNACRYTDAPGLIRLSVLQSKQTIEVIVEDSAPGLTQAQFEKVFERLYRADRSRSRKLGGSGLGLAICRELVLAHQGQITADESRLGGIKIQFQIPLN